VLLLETGSGKQRLLLGHEEEVTAVFLSPDGKTAVSGSRDKTAIVWDTATGKVLRRLQGHSENLRAVLLSPDGQSVYTAAEDASVRRWNSKSGELERTFGFAVGVHSLAISRDGKRLLAGAFDGMITAFSTESGEELCRYAGHRSDVNSVQYSPDGATILSSSSDTTARLWRSTGCNSSPDPKVRFGSELRQFPVKPGIATDAAYAPNGKQFVVSSSNGVIQLWATKNLDNFFNGPMRPVTNTPVQRPSANLTNLVVGDKTLEIELSVINPKGGDPKTALSFDVFIGNIASEKVEVRDIGVVQANTRAQKVRLIATLPDNLRDGEHILKIVVSNQEATAETISRNFTYTAKSASLQNLYVLAVGINNYSDTRIRPLGSAVNDATDIAEFFKGQEKKTYSKVEVSLFTDQNAKYAQVKKRMGELRQQATARDTVLLFFAGHGFNQDGSYFIPLADSERDNFEATALSQQDLTSFVGRTRARSLVFVDTCHAGAILGENASDLSSSMDALTNSLSVAALALGAGKNDRIVLAASQGSQFAQERSNLRNGVFTHILLQALRGQAADEFGEVYINSLIAYVTRQVPRLAGNLQKPQRYAVGDDFLVAKK
jgi:hypothetical protein